MGDLVVAVALASGTAAWVTTRAAGNLAHRRPHLPSELARSRTAVVESIGVGIDALHFMAQVHGADVGVVDAATAWGAEMREVDALVTSEPGRVLCVQVADCIPVLLAAPGGPVAAVHVGRRGLVADVLGAVVDRLPDTDLTAALGPAIGGCCYEVPAELRDDVAVRHPDAYAETTWGTPSLDLPAGARSRLSDLGVRIVDTGLRCTRCDPDQRWFSHRADPDTGRQLGLVMITEAA